MPFCLKNVGATYKRMMNKVLWDQIEKNIEAYVDDMVVKTKQGTSHMTDLEETFSMLVKYNLKLNLTKSKFGVKPRKFLGYMTSERDIEANPEKIKVVMKLTEPRCVKDIQRLNGCIAALGKFVSKLVENCMSIFKALKSSGKDCKWGEECSKAWRELKSISITVAPTLFSNSRRKVVPILVSIRLRNSFVLIKEVDSKQHTIYFVSKVLKDVESRYSNIEKVLYSLIVFARKFRAYFESHPIVVYMNAPLRKISHKLDQSGRMLKWSIELRGLDITFVPKIVIEAQTLADFLVESSLTENTNNKVVNISTKEDTNSWIMMVDGVINSRGVGASFIVSLQTLYFYFFLLSSPIN